MPDILYRTTSLAPDEGRTIFGLAVPYGIETQIGDKFGGYTERFSPGAFTRSIQERGSKVRLHVAHDTRRLPIGVATDLTEKPDGLHAAFLLADTPAADEVLALARAGAVDFSIGFAPIRSRQDEGVTVRTEASIREVSVVGMPAYESATIDGVRSAPTPLTVELATRRLSLTRF